MAARMPLLSGRFVASRLSPRASSSLSLPTRPSLALPRGFRTAQRGRQYSSQPPKRNDNVKFWPFLVVIGVGSLGYVGLVNRRKGELLATSTHLCFSFIYSVINKDWVWVCSWYEGSSPRPRHRSMQPEDELLGLHYVSLLLCDQIRAHRLRPFKPPPELSS